MPLPPNLSSNLPFVFDKELHHLLTVYVCCQRYFKNIIYWQTEAKTYTIIQTSTTKIRKFDLFTFSNRLIGLLPCGCNQEEFWTLSPLLPFSPLQQFFLEINHPLLWEKWKNWSQLNLNHFSEFGHLIGWIRLLIGKTSWINFNNHSYKSKDCNWCVTKPFQKI